MNNKYNCFFRVSQVLKMSRLAGLGRYGCGYHDSHAVALFSKGWRHAQVCHDQHLGCYQDHQEARQAARRQDPDAGACVSCVCCVWVCGCVCEIESERARACACVSVISYLRLRRIHLLIGYVIQNLHGRVKLRIKICRATCLRGCTALIQSWCSLNTAHYSLNTAVIQPW